MFWTVFFIILIIFAMIGGAVNGLVTIFKGEFDNDDSGITWLVILIILILLFFM
jgi:Na+-driven multidrug efflux pump